MQQEDEDGMMNLEQIIPHIPSLAMNETVGFFKEVFGFKVSSESDNYIELNLGKNLLGILSSQGEPNQQSIYLKVNDIEKLWSEVSPMIKDLHAKPLFTQDYGMKEFHVVVPGSNTLLFVGELVNA